MWMMDAYDLGKVDRSYAKQAIFSASFETHVGLSEGIIDGLKKHECAAMCVGSHICLFDSPFFNTATAESKGTS